MAALNAAVHAGNWRRTRDLLMAYPQLTGVAGALTLDVWFLPIFLLPGDGTHHTVDVRPGDLTSNEGVFYEGDSGNTVAHEFGHMIGNPDEYHLPGSKAEIPASLGLSEAEKARSSVEGITGRAAPKTPEGYTLETLMGDQHKSTAVRARHAWDVLEVFNEKLRLPGEPPWMVESKT